MEDQPDGSSGENQSRFFESELEAPEVGKAGGCNQCGRNVDDGPSSQHHGRTRDGACRGGSRSSHEGADPTVLPTAYEPAPGNNHPEVDWSEDADAGNDRTRQAADQVTDEDGRDHHWSGSDQAHRNRVQELTLAEPVVFQHDTLMQERHDRKATAEDEGACLKEEEEEGDQRGRTGGRAERRKCLDWESEQ